MKKGSVSEDGAYRFEAVKNFLIVRTSAMGDILHGMPVAAALKERYPHCRIIWVIEGRYQELLAGNPCVDGIVVVRFKDWMHSLGESQGRRNWIGVVRQLRRFSFDAAIDLQGLTRSGLVSYLSRAPIRIGFPKGHVREVLNLVFSNVCPRSIPARSHVIDRNLALLHALGIHTREKRFSFRVPARVEEGVKRYLRDTESSDRALRVAIHPAAGWITKQWSPKRYAEIADRLLTDREARVFLLWGPGERELAQQVQGTMKRSGQVIPEMGLAALVAFLQQCDLFIGGDSGPLHLACALAVPVVGLYGPSDPVRNGPFQGTHRVVTASSPCGPCYKRICTESSCMETIDVAEVWEAVRDMVEGLEARPRGGERLYENGTA